ncbi:MAG: amidase [Rhodospirillales bacterium]|nr:amidase [Rhodospirillales bacterium]
MKTLRELEADLVAGRCTSRDLVTQALGRIADPAGEGMRAVTVVYTDAALAAAGASDRLRAHGVVPSPLAGIPVSIKDLFDVAGETTRAGSTALVGAPAAAADAPVVARLRAAGAVIVGKTNMTEFAYSGLGLNPHYGTPANPWDRTARRIPGGSSSGAAVSVTDGMAAAAIGTDTGGSARIPAALCGLTGFKPTARRVPRAGVLPLSTSLDSVGPLAPSVACCALVDAILAGEPPVVPAPPPLAALSFAIPRNYALDDMDATVAAAFESALRRLAAGGARLAEIAVPAFERMPETLVKGGLAAGEAFAWHRDLIARKGTHYDPRVLSRILRGQEQSAAEYIDLLALRRALIMEAEGQLAPYHAILMPTTPIIAPPIADLADEAAYTQANFLVLRNPTLANYFDRCALSLSCHAPGAAPAGLMLVGPHGADRALLAAGLAVEQCLKSA